MKRGDAGFTLLEMLVALVVFGLVMDGIAQTFRFGLTAWSTGPARTAAPENLAALDGALTRMIGQAMPGSMTGLPNQLSFTTPLPAGAGLPGALADTAMMTADGRLILRYVPHPAGIPLGPPPVPKIEILANGVTMLQASYLKPHVGAPAWSGKWKGNGMPLLVRIHLQFANGRDWPDLIVAPVGG
jgi:general secretion pathway protein J